LQTAFSDQRIFPELKCGVEDVDAALDQFGNALTLCQLTHAEAKKLEEAKAVSSCQRTVSAASSARQSATEPLHQDSDAS
jgi:hypothetical protein